MHNTPPKSTYADPTASQGSRSNQKIQRHKDTHAVIQMLNDNPEHRGKPTSELIQLHRESVKLRSKSISEPRSVTNSEAKPFEFFECKRKFDDVIECFATTHGGATLWTGQKDGTIAIRNGDNGKILYIIDPSISAKTEEELGGESESEHPYKITFRQDENGKIIYPTVTTMFSNDFHIWIGYEDGSIRIYDVLVYILLFEAKFHTDAITAFNKTFDNKIFSSSKDGSLIKWGSNIKGFDIISKLSDLNSPINDITSYGFHGFAACSSGEIAQFDIELCCWEKKYISHTGAVNCLLFSEGFLISGGNDSKIIIWNVETGDAICTIDYHNDPIKFLYANTVTKQIWSGDEAGTVNVWQNNYSVDFPRIHCFQVDEDAIISSFYGMVSRDTMKIWSLSSNGYNCVWKSSVNKIEMKIQIVIDSMSSIIAGDRAEIQRLKIKIEKLNELTKTLRKKQSAALEHIYGESSLHKMFYRWCLWLKKRILQMTQSLEIENMKKCNNINLTWKYSQIWKQYTINSINNKFKIVWIETVNQKVKREKAMAIYHTFKKFIDHMKSAKRTKLISQNIESIYLRALHLYYYNHLYRFQMINKFIKKKKLIVENMYASQVCLIQNTYFNRWKAHIFNHKRMKLFSMRANTMYNLYTKKLTGIYFYKLVIFIKAQNIPQLSKKIALINERNATLRTKHNYYIKWYQYTSDKKLEVIDNEVTKNEHEIKELLEKIKSVEYLIKQSGLIIEYNNNIQNEDTNIEEIKSNLESNYATNKEYLSIINEKKKGTENVPELTAEEQMDEAMYSLKILCINVNRDFSIISKLYERIKEKKIGKSDLFNEGFINLHKTIASMLRMKSLSNEEPWPIKANDIKNVKSMFFDSILSAIRTIIFAYDAMNLQLRNKNENISILMMNIENLQQLVKCIVSKKYKIEII